MLPTLLLSLLAAALQPAAAQPPTDAATVAAAMQPRLPHRFGGDFSLVAAAADGHILVLTFEIAPSAMDGATPLATTASLIEGFCLAPAARAALDGPMSVRADARSSDGRTLTGVIVERCPPAADLPLPPPGR